MLFTVCICLDFDVLKFSSRFTIHGAHLLNPCSHWIIDTSRFGIAGIGEDFVHIWCCQLTRSEDWIWRLAMGVFSSTWGFFSKPSWLSIQRSQQMSVGFSLHHLHAVYRLNLTEDSPMPMVVAGRPHHPGGPGDGSTFSKFNRPDGLALDVIGQRRKKPFWSCESHHRNYDISSCQI